MLAGLSRHRSVGSVLTPANDTVGVPTVHPTKQPAARTGRGLVVIGLLACAGLLVNALLSSNGGSTSGPLASVSSAPSASRMPDETGPAPDISRLPVAPQPIEAVADVEKTEPTSLIDAGTARNALRYTTTDVNLRSGPGRQFAVAMVVPGGTEVLLVEAGRGWSRVRVGEDRVGWISNSTFEER